MAASTLCGVDDSELSLFHVQTQTTSPTTSHPLSPVVPCYNDSYPEPCKPKVYSSFKMNHLLAATLLLLLASAPNAKAADVGVLGLRGADTTDGAADDEDASGRHLQASLGDWAFCTNSDQCKNHCCSKKYSTSDGRLKCTPVGGFKPSEGCVGKPPPSAGCWPDGTTCSYIFSCFNCCNTRVYVPERRRYECGRAI